MKRKKQFRRRKKQTVLARLLKRVKVPYKDDGSKDFDKCWIWHGVVNNAGYGMLKVNDEVKMATAHRIMMIEYNKALRYGDKINVLHNCGVKECVNPKHLILGTVQDRINLQIKYKKWNPDLGNYNYYKICDHCGETTYTTWFSRKHRLCELNASHKYLTDQIIRKKSKC